MVKTTGRKRCLKVLRAGLILYALVCVGCASFQRRLIYFPPVFDAATADQMGRAAGLERWAGPAGQPLGWKRPASLQPARGSIVILHGNGGAAVQLAHYAGVIQQAAALDVFIVEYPGYADRPGAPTEKSLETAAVEAFQALDTNRPVYVVGESLGTGVAAYLAGRFPDHIAGVVLLAPYNSLTDVAQEHMPLLPVHLLLVDRYPSEEFLRNYHGPVAMLVSGGDVVVPEKFGRRLYEGYAGPKRLWYFPDGNHGTVMLQPPELWAQIFGFLEGKDLTRR